MNPKNDRNEASSCFNFSTPYNVPALTSVEIEIYTSNNTVGYAFPDFPA